MYPILNSAITKVKNQPLFYIFYVNINNNLFPIQVNDSAAHIFKLCNGLNTIDNIVQILSNYYNENYDKVKEYVNDFLNDSKKYGHIFLSENCLSSATILDEFGSKEFWIPDFIVLELTEECPLRCKHCYLDAGHGTTMEYELFIKILNEMIELKIDKIQLTGGEPLLHPKFFQILELCINNDIDTQLFTSGFLASQDIINKFNSYVGKKITFQISIDGLEEYHDDFRGVKYSYKNAINFITEMHNKGFTVMVGMTIIKQEYKEISQLCDILKSIGVSMLRIGPVSNRGRAKTNNIEELKNNVLNARMITKQLSIEKNDKNFKVVYFEENQDHLNSKYIVNCGLGQTLLKISPSGDVYPCAISDLKIGEVRNHTIKTIQQKTSRLFEILQKPGNQKCNNCKNSVICHNCIVESLLYGKNENVHCDWYNSQRDLIEKIEYSESV